MLKKLGVLIAGAVAALLVGTSAPAEACCATIHNCNSGSLCIYMNSNYGGSQTNQTTAAIFNASGDCWKFNSTWSNKVSSWYANFDIFNGQTVEMYFYDNTSCTGSNIYEGQAPQGQATMGIYNDWVGSIKLVQP